MSLSKFIDKKPIKNVLHIGAYNGGEAPAYNSWGFEKVVWIEADPEIYKELVNNISNGEYSFESILFNQLVSDKDDEDTDFHRYHYQDNRGMSSILKKISGSAGRESAEYNEKTYYKGTIELKSVTIDTLFQRDNLDFDIDFINIDTQGSELLILSGAKKVLEKVKYINAEATFSVHDYENGVYFDDLYDYLKQFGFVHVGNPSVSGDGTWGDSFFEKIDTSNG